MNILRYNNILVTGASGFIGRNLCEKLEHIEGLTVNRFDSSSPKINLYRYLQEVDIIYHLAGVSRPSDLKEFETINVGITRKICKYLDQIRRTVKIVYSSSIQIENDSLYGDSKKDAENILREYSLMSQSEVVTHRLKNIFGKYSRPNYCSVVANFCYNTKYDIPIKINEPSKEIELVYVDTITDEFIYEMETRLIPGFVVAKPIAGTKISLQDLADTVQKFKTSEVVDFKDPFIKNLYYTYNEI